MARDSVSAALFRAFAPVRRSSEWACLQERSIARLAIHAYVNEARRRGAAVHDVLVDVVRVSGVASIAAACDDLVKVVVRWVVQDYFPSACVPRRLTDDVTEARLGDETRFH